MEYARRLGDKHDIPDLEKSLNELFKKASPTFYITGFDHPDVPVITNVEPGKIQLFAWGLIPFWVKNSIQAVELSRRTLNARGEEMFDKPSFKNAARNRRCLVITDGFYEYHWKNNKSFPFFIRFKNGDPMILGGIWDTWFNKEGGIYRNTFSIVTTRANNLMTDIHNRPKASEGPRMPVILTEGAEDQWLNLKTETKTEQEEFSQLLNPLNDSLLEAYTVGVLKGRNGIGNLPRAQEKYEYKDLL